MMGNYGSRRALRNLFWRDSIMQLSLPCTYYEIVVSPIPFASKHRSFEIANNDDYLRASHYDWGGTINSRAWEITWTSEVTWRIQSLNTSSFMSRKMCFWRIHGLWLGLMGGVFQSMFFSSPRVFTAFVLEFSRLIFSIAKLCLHVHVLGDVVTRN